MTVISKHKASNFDLSEKQSALDMLVESLGAGSLQEKPIKTRCIKCNTTSHLQKHKVIKTSKESLIICTVCNKLLTKLYITGSQVAHGNIKIRTEYTNQLRVALSNWFIKTPLPANTKSFSKSITSEILKSIQFKIEPLSAKQHMFNNPWRHDFKNNCVKCNKAYHLQEHHITYNPDLKAFLCVSCHAKITGLNTRAARIAYTSKEFKPDYTNRVRIILWRWFIANTWPTTSDNIPVRRLSKALIRKILYTIEPSSLSTKTVNI
jgi:GTPase SAR1 family protein